MSSLPPSISEEEKTSDLEVKKRRAGRWIRRRLVLGGGWGGGLEGAGYSRPGVRCHWLMGDIHHPVPQWQEAAAHEWDDRFSPGTRQMAGGRKVELKIQRKTLRTLYLPDSWPCHQPHSNSGDANLNWLRRAINHLHKLFWCWSGSITDILWEINY